MERRGFVQQRAAGACGAALPGLLRPDALDIVRRATSRLTGTAEESATDEEFWREIQQAFSINRSPPGLGCVSVARATREAWFPALDVPSLVTEERGAHISHSDWWAHSGLTGCRTW